MADPLAVSVNQAAEMIGLAPRTLRDYCRRRVIGYTRRGRRILIPVAEIRRILEQDYVPPLTDGEAAPRTE